MMLLLALMVFVAATDAHSLGGSWQVRSNVFGSESDRTCTFVQEDSVLKGTCTSDHGADLVAGKVEDHRVTWQLKTQDAGKPLTLEFTGTARSDKDIVGTVSLVELGVDGEFTATRTNKERN